MKSDSVQLPLDLPGTVGAPENSSRRNWGANKLDGEDRAFHDWYRFVLSFPPHLVRQYINDFRMDGGQTLLDPFCGTGTTIVESKLSGIRAIGIEANPFACFASSVKTDWRIDPDVLCQESRRAAEDALELLGKQGIDDQRPFTKPIELQTLRRLSDEQTRLILSDSISPIPLHKTLVLLDCLRRQEGWSGYRHQLLALANTLVFTASNLHFGPEVGIGKAKADAPVVSAWLSEIQKVARDLRKAPDDSSRDTRIYLADARQVATILVPNSIDAVITSPPYPNEKDYTRTTRLESVVLGFVGSRAELRQQKQGFLRSNTRGVYKGDDDDKWVSGHPEIQSIVAAIENRRRELGKDSGFERMYGRVTQLYFGGMARHLAQLRTVLRPGARLAYVVGDQASYLRVMIRTGQLLADIAQMLGYEAERTDLFRTRFSTATKEQLREEVVVLRWTG